MYYATPLHTGLSLSYSGHLQPGLDCIEIVDVHVGIGKVGIGVVDYGTNKACLIIPDGVEDVGDYGVVDRRQDEIGGQTELEVLVLDHFPHLLVILEDPATYINYLGKSTADSSLFIQTIVALNSLIGWVDPDLVRDGCHKVIDHMGGLVDDDFTLTLE
jgi:hypothetical protein